MTLYQCRACGFVTSDQEAHFERDGHSAFDLFVDPFAHPDTSSKEGRDG